MNATLHTTVSQRIELASRFYQLIQLSKNAGPASGTSTPGRRSRPRTQIKNPALSAGRIRHTWTNSLVAQLMSILIFVTNLAFHPKDARCVFLGIETLRAILPPCPQ
jgi:hypothetical protein